MANRKAGASADFFIGQTFGELEPDEFAGSLVKRFQTEAHQTNALPMRDLLVRQRLRVHEVRGRVRAFICVSFERDNFARFAAVIEREVMRGAVKPAPWVLNLLKMCVQSHESFLDDVLGE